jgi:Kef-type K+ transport system membrane component KefB
VPLFLAQALLVPVLPALLWHAARLRRLVPLAVVQILTGVALGPAFLGALLPGLLGPLIAPTALAPLEGIATLAVLLCAFTTGLHLEPEPLRGRGPAFLRLGVGSTALPALLGGLVALPLAALHPGLPGPGTPAGTFAAGIGIAIGVTALPVLGAILREMGLLGQPPGRLALACAAVSDALLWLPLALLLASAEGGGAMPPLLGGPAYALLLLAAARSPLARLPAPRAGEGAAAGHGDLGLIAACATALGSAAVTEALGLHAVLGAFLAGAVMPRHLRWPLLLRLEAPVAVMLMPFFFALTGLRTAIEPGHASFLALFLLVGLIPARGPRRHGGQARRGGAPRPIHGRGLAHGAGAGLTPAGQGADGGGGAHRALGCRHHRRHRLLGAGAGGAGQHGAHHAARPAVPAPGATPGRPARSRGRPWRRGRGG